MMTEICYSGYRFPPEIFQQVIWLYVRFTLSVRRWVNHFGPTITANLRKRRPKPHTNARHPDGRRQNRSP
jgi:putative transposase